MPAALESCIDFSMGMSQCKAEACTILTFHATPGVTPHYHSGCGCTDRCMAMACQA